MTPRPPLTPVQQARADHWAKVHIAGDRAEPIRYAITRAARRLLGPGTRTERRAEG